jgi:hypothetical protein
LGLVSTDFAAAILFADAICSGTSRIEMADFALAWRSLMDFASVAVGLACLPAGN